MKYVSIDIETTGLDPETCQVFEFAAVFDNGEPFPEFSGVNELPTFHRYIKHDRYHFEPFALGMHAKRDFKIIVEEGISIERLGDEFQDWLNNKMPGVKNYTVAGKNFGSFDWQFLKGLRRFPKPSYRFLDVGSLYTRWSDTGIPNLSTCLERAGLPSAVEHDAIDDARQVVELIRRHYCVR